MFHRVNPSGPNAKSFAGYFSPDPPGNASSSASIRMIWCTLPVGVVAGDRTPSLSGRARSCASCVHLHMLCNSSTLKIAVAGLTSAHAPLSPVIAVRNERVIVKND